MSRVGEHVLAELGCRRSSVDAAAESVAHQREQIPAVVQASVREDNGTNGAGSEWQITIDLECLAPMPLQ